MFWRKKTTIETAAKKTSDGGRCEIVICKLRLNLLTPEGKAALRSHLLFVTLRDALLVLFVECAVFGSILLGTRIILEQNFREAVEQSVGITTTFSANNREIKTLNDQFAAIDKIHRQFVPIGDFYGDLTGLIPPNVTVTSLVIDVAGGRLKIRGTARTRAELNKLQSTLADSALLSELESPLSNLFVKTEIPFEFSARVNLSDVPAPTFFPPPPAAASSTAL